MTSHEGGRPGKGGPGTANTRSQGTPTIGGRAKYRGWADARFVRTQQIHERASKMEALYRRDAAYAVIAGCEEAARHAVVLADECGQLAADCWVSIQIAEGVRERLGDPATAGLLSGAEAVAVVVEVMKAEGAKIQAEFARREQREREEQHALGQWRERRREHMRTRRASLKPAVVTRSRTRCSQCSRERRATRSSARSRDYSGSDGEGGEPDAPRPRRRQRRKRYRGHTCCWIGGAA